MRSTGISGGASVSSLATIEVQYPGIVPAFPGDTVVRAVVTPPPPLLPDGGLVAEVVPQLFAAYVCGLKHVLGVVRKPKLPKITPEMTGARSLVSAVGILRARKLSPVMWCVHSLERWKRTLASYVPAHVKCPAWTWVYSTTRMGRPEEIKEALRVQNAHPGRVMAMGAAHKLLLEKWHAMRASVVRLQNPTRETVTKAVELYFSSGHYDSLVKAAQKETEGLQRFIDEKVARGEFVW